MENLDFLNLNTQRAFPIRELQTRKSTDGNFTIPDNFIADILLAIDADIQTRVYISEITNIPEQVTIKISKTTGDYLGSFTINTATHSLYDVYYLSASPAYASATGKLVVAYLTRLAKIPTGTFQFAPDTTEFETRTIVPALAAISRLIFKDASGNLFSATGDVDIVARLNMRFRQDTDNVNTVYMDAANGLGLNKTCTADTPAIETINGVSPDSAGNFSISFIDCDSIQPTTNGLILGDSCNKPCLGCDEIGQLTDRLVSFEADMLKLRDFLDEMNATLLQFSNVINLQCEIA